MGLQEVGYRSRDRESWWGFVKAAMNLLVP